VHGQSPQPIDDASFESLRLVPSPATLPRPAERRGRPTLEEPPQHVSFEPTGPVRLRLDPDAEALNGERGRWRRKIDLPPCRLVWIGAVTESPDNLPTPHIEALVRPLTATPGVLGPPEVSTLPITTLPLLSVGRVLKKPGAADEDRGGPSLEQRFLGSEWSVDLSFEPSQTSVKTAAELGLIIETLADQPRFADPPLCIVTDEARGRLVGIPCWEIVRVYYAWAPLAARLLFQFPRWRAGTLEHLLLSFEGHRFTGPARGRRTVGESAAYAALQLQRIGREAAVSYASAGRAQIRAVPPFVGAATLRCVAMPFTIDGYDGLFVQQIIASQPAPDAKAGIEWGPVAVRPHFGSAREAAAWWAAYRCGFVPDLVHGSRQSWPDYVAIASAQAEAAALRSHGQVWLTDALVRVLTGQSVVSAAQANRRRSAAATRALVSSATASARSSRSRARSVAAANASASKG